MRNVYSNINDLEEIIFIGGTNYILEFNVYDELGVLIDITSSTVEWTMSYYGQPDTAILTKTGTKTGTNTFEIEIDSVDTVDLEGKFIHQPVITDLDQNEFRPSQGILTIVPRIQND